MIRKVKKFNSTKKELLSEIADYIKDSKWDSAVRYPRRLNRFTGKYQDSTTHPLKGVGDNYLDDVKFMTKVVSIDAKSLKYSSKRLKNNKHIVKKAIINSPDFGFEYSSKELKKDKDLVLWCIKNKYQINFWDINKNLLNDKDLTYQFIKTFNYCPFWTYGEDMSSSNFKGILKQQINRLPKFFINDKVFIKKIRKINLIDQTYKDLKKFKLLKNK
jgi:hypothetical protein